jgi:hypothetical protein
MASFGREEAVDSLARLDGAALPSPFFNVPAVGGIAPQSTIFRLTLKHRFC